VELAAAGVLYLALQEGPGTLDLPALDFAWLGTRSIVGIVMLIHMFFAQLFVGFIIGSPLLQAWGVRKGNAHMQRLSHGLDRFNVLTFSIGATFAGMFLVLIVGFYPRVTSALFTHFFWFFPTLAMGAMVLTLLLLYLYHYRTQRRSIVAGLGAAFFILVWQAILTGVDTFMVTGGEAGEPTLQSGGDLSFSSLGEALGSIFNPMFIPLDLHRTFGNLSWPAFAVAAWAAFRYRGAKSAEDKAFYDWAGSMGVMWGTIFLLLQPFAGFATAYTMKAAYQPNAPMVEGTGGPFDRLVGSGPGADSFTSDLLYINLVGVVGLFVFSNVAMYLGAKRHPERAGRVPIRFFGLVAAVAGLYAISPIADWPFLYMRYIMILLMVLATMGATIAYVRGRGRFRYGSPGRGYRAVLLLIGVIAVGLTLNMGFMKSNSRVPYTIYGEPQYKVNSERPVTQEQIESPTRP
jgi:cytochrome bd-type quinol oxidase subunit 1